MPAVTRSSQYKYSSAVRNAQQVIAVPAAMTRLQVPPSVLFSNCNTHPGPEMTESQTVVIAVWSGVI